MTRKIRTWNGHIYDFEEVVASHDNKDDKMTMLYGFVLAYGVYSHLDYTKGKKILYKYHKLGEIDASYNLLMAISKRLKRETFLEENDIEVFHELSQHFEAMRFSPGIFQMGLIYEFGWGDYVKSDHSKSMYFYNEAKKLGHLAARRRLLTERMKKIGLNFAPFKYIARLPLMLEGALIAYQSSHDDRINF